MQNNDIHIIGHAAIGLLALGMLMFFWMIFKGVKKVKKKGRKAVKRTSRFDLYLEELENFKKNWFYDI
jgi:flagellar basal body-associated protein FliL